MSEDDVEEVSCVTVDANKLRAENVDKALVEVICNYMGGNDKSPMVFFVTVAHMIGCMVGDGCKNEDEVKTNVGEMAGLVVGLMAASAMSVFENKDASEIPAEIHTGLRH